MLGIINIGECKVCYVAQSARWVDIDCLSADWLGNGPRLLVGAIFLFFVCQTWWIPNNHARMQYLARPASHLPAS